MPFSDNGQLVGLTHPAGSSTTTVPDSGSYEVAFSVSYTAGVGSSIAVAVNGKPVEGTVVPLLTSTGQVSGQAILRLASGDAITIRNNTKVAITLALSPSVGAQMLVKRLN